MSKCLSGKALLPDSAVLNLLSVKRLEHSWTIRAEMRTLSATCPLCGSVSRARHSRYWRNLRDLPVTGQPVQLKLRVSRWRCRSDPCPRYVFSERLPGVVEAHAQETSRLREILELVGRQLGGRPGEALLRRIGMPVSDDTLLCAGSSVRLQCRSLITFRSSA